MKYIDYVVHEFTSTCVLVRQGEREHLSGEIEAQGCLYHNHSGEIEVQGCLYHNHSGKIEAQGGLYLNHSGEVFGGQTLYW